MKKILLLSTILTIFFIACENQSGNTGNTENHDQHGTTGTETTTTPDNSTVTAGQVYTCPMHPEVTSDKPGKCPKCKMDLVLQEDAQDTAE